MNEFDEMKDNSSGNDPEIHMNGHDSRMNAENGSTDPRGGQGYTNTDGSHGFIYNPPPSAEVKNRSYRGALIAMATVLAALMMGTFCFLGAYMATQSLYGREDDSPRGEGDPDSYEAGTSDGLFISADTNDAEKQEDVDLSGDRLQDSAEEETKNQGMIQFGNGAVPPVASIVKLPAKRTDMDGDGHPEVETDASGEVLTSAGTNAVSVATVVNRVAASVVEITTETIVQSGRVGQYITSGAGSGVIVSDEGFIVTNHHVIDGANSITVRLNDGKEFDATLVGTDEQTDIAVLWIQAGDYDLTVATLGASFDLVVGEDILAIGNPLGSLGGTVTEGMISATAREISVSGVNMTLLQVSAPINPGNSGGGLFNLAGELVGIVNAKMASEDIEGLGFAIPVDTAYTVILELIDHGYVKNRPGIDFSVMDVTSIQTAMRYFNSFYTGVYVNEKNHTTVQYGDLILTADGVEVNSVEELNRMIMGKSIGDTVELLVYRNRQKITVTVTVSEFIPDVLKSTS